MTYRVAAALMLLGVAPTRAQPVLEPRSARFWLGAAGLVGAGALLDERIREDASSWRRPALDDLASAVDPLGRARYLLPSLATAVVIPRLAGHRAISDAALRIALGYLAADAVESVLKPAVGRHRPDSTGRPWHLRPFSADEQWHSFPSAHTVHAFAIASALSREAHTPWVTVPSYALATLVGAQRVYRRAHWASDVAASAALSIAASSSTVVWLERHGLRPLVRPR